MLFIVRVPDEELLNDDEFHDAVIVLDNMMTSVFEQYTFIDLFTKGSYHKKASVILIVQNSFHQDKAINQFKLTVSHPI